MTTLTCVVITYIYIEWSDVHNTRIAHWFTTNKNDEHDEKVIWLYVLKWSVSFSQGDVVITKGGIEEMVYFWQILWSDVMWFVCVGPFVCACVRACNAYHLETGAVVIKISCQFARYSTTHGFTNMKLNRIMSRSQWKCCQLHTYRLNQSKWIFSTKILKR